jgi:hypothetical protein
MEDLGPFDAIPQSVTTSLGPSLRPSADSPTVLCRTHASAESASLRRACSACPQQPHEFLDTLHVDRGEQQCLFLRVAYLSCAAYGNAFPPVLSTVFASALT